MKVLLLGSGSFAALGLAETLGASGHEVWTFDRGASSESQGRRLRGDVRALDESGERLGRFDVLLNFIVLKNESLEMNLNFCRSIARFVERTGSARLLHISSVSVLPAASGVVSEADLPDRHSRHKGEYSRTKIETEAWFRENLRAAELIVVRPGFVLGPGLADPIVGMAQLLPGRRLLGLGSASSTIPLIDRRLLHRALERLIRARIDKSPVTCMLVARNSPRRREYLEFCAQGLGFAGKPCHLPKLVWLGALAAGSVAFSILKRRPVNLAARLAHNLRDRAYDCAATERLIGLNLRTDWQKALLESDPAQEGNFEMPDVDHAAFQLGPQLRDNPLQRVLYVGLGRITHERHLPALEKLNAGLAVEWWDPFVKEPRHRGKLTLQKLDSIEQSKATHAVIATPPSARAEVLARLPDSVKWVLCEKPLVVTASHWQAIRPQLQARPHAYVLHNYRFKPNVERMIGFLRRFNPGRLERVQLDFDSPPVSGDGAAWLRRERQSRTLLMDYAVHFIDLALAFTKGEAVIQNCRTARNERGETARVTARLGFENCQCDINLRQGVRERQCKLVFVFHNYTCHLTFFPETFQVVGSRHSFADDCAAAWSGFGATARKVMEKLGFTSVEPSHHRVLGAFLGYYPVEAIDDLALPGITGFYEILLALEQRVYSDT